MRKRGHWGACGAFWGWRPTCKTCLGLDTEPCRNPHSPTALASTTLPTPINAAPRRLDAGLDGHGAPAMHVRLVRW
eukprot:3556705-Pyramimonas_sp.AAC.1